MSRNYYGWNNKGYREVKSRSKNMGKVKKDSLGDRMKQYENVNERYLVPKIPFIIRVDGIAFHTYTKKCKKPFDSLIGDTMQATMQALCSDIPGTVLGYTQSDEITIVCKYTDRIVSQAWFKGRVRKIETCAAAKATKYFNKFFAENLDKLIKESDETDDYIKNMKKKCWTAEFDARVFNIPEWDCINNVIWRQQDAIRNSVEMVGHCYYSAKELNKVNNEQIKEKLLTEKNIDWNKFPYYNQRGTFCYVEYVKKEVHGKAVLRREWTITKHPRIIQKWREWFHDITGLNED